MRLAALLSIAVVAAALAGCANPLKDPPARHYRDMGFAGADVSGTVPAAWPDLSGERITLLDQGAFAWTFPKAAAQFERLTGAKVELVHGGDAGTALQQAIDAKGRPPADVIYGIDNALLGHAVAHGVVHPYKPVLAVRIAPDNLFFGTHSTPEHLWHATPVDYGFIGVNYDPREVPPIGSLAELRENADVFVTQDPRLSSPGLGFLLTTIGAFGEHGVYTWQDYWRELLEEGVEVTPDWTQAYEGHYSAGYGSPDAGGEGAGDRAIVTSYTQSPAFEAYNGLPEGVRGRAAAGPAMTFKQVETMAILDGTDSLAAAEAWIEFTLTDAFQALLAPNNAMYPVVEWVDPKVDPERTFGTLDPEPGTFEPVTMDWQHVATNLERWICEWDALYESTDETICAVG